MKSHGDTTPHALPETEEQRRARIAREADLIAAARASLAAGRGITGAALEAWFAADEATDEPVPVPDVSGPRARFG